MLATIDSLAELGISAVSVDVEVHLSRGLPKLNIVGLPEAAVRESKDRVRGAIINSGFEFPQMRITVNLAPADLPKQGGRFDLPIALGILVATGQVKASCVKGMLFLGELALSGKLRNISGTLVAAMAAREANKALVLPFESARQARLVQSAEIAGVDSLLELASVLSGMQNFAELPPIQFAETTFTKDISEVVGNEFAKYALEVSAAGKHSLLFMGSPGTGKTMLASRIPTIMPPMSEREALMTACIYSYGNTELNLENWRQRPFRAPHHSASGIALIGGGSFPKPGEISKANAGVLFLDELTEFNRRDLDMLRQPLETGEVHIARATQQVTFYADFLLVAAANPCSCGYYLEDSGKCRCTPDQIQRYQSKLSGPLMDRIDIQIHVSRVPYNQLQAQQQKIETSAQVRERVIRARKRQIERQQKLNSRLSKKDIDCYCVLDEMAQNLAFKAIEKFELSNRAYHRIIKVARTIADLHDNEHISSQDVGIAVKMCCAR